ncbi:MBL fold metallo-hydrolase [Devriesea agamarum]|uniref:MBL fold metallo-hydrolase n=1 Tax=Devriesea agamarum TaxID=472569 RepID=UPI00071E312B|nr:MBL fold metallo-hydrolase [Devriesea agamarum]
MIRIHTLVSPFLGANCYILSAHQRAEAQDIENTAPSDAGDNTSHTTWSQANPSHEVTAVVIDPGWDTTDRVVDYVQSIRATRVNIVATHGHLDHIADLGLLCERISAICGEVSIGLNDQSRLDDPIEDLPEMFTTQLRPIWQVRGWTRPADARLLREGDEIEVAAGAALRVIDAPGHTEGSVLLQLVKGGSDVAGDTSDAKEKEDASVVPAVLTTEDSSRSPGGRREWHRGVVFTGDVLFAGGVGRTDLPGGDMKAMHRSLARFAELPGDFLILPGHGPSSTIRHELTNNWYLREACQGHLA